ncbi:hypothetical protein SDC9_119460 [bioreactor metagenome]|uniref:FUSC family protein n=1 Tax=bioreactor metagenome TaxID=1076179 RepID=A0A645C9G2_9ZZZZ
MSDSNPRRMMPRVGFRNLKTALSTTLCAALYLIIGRNPAFACIGAVFGMGTDMPNSRLHGGNRFFGTIIGGLLGMGLFRLYLLIQPDGAATWKLLPLLAVGMIVLVVISDLFWPGAVQPGGVVLSILLYKSPPDTYISYALNRMVDTGIGVAMSLLVNYLLPRERLEAWAARLRGQDEESLLSRDR